MIAMPYIVVNMVLGILSLMFFCVTSAALLSKYPSANRHLPAQLRRSRSLAFVANGFMLSVLSIVVVLVVKRLSTPKIQRRLVIASCSVVMTLVPVIAVAAAVVGLFIIK